ncbi:YoaK family protein [Pararoseomonas sp. SCSIO 73927]|uniref:YoaK family protein n=1 Tax=Pararoseomonas sp. SCSIO 73927 TaxID=3114537 RepID=UPI0030CFDCAF
MTNFGRLAVSEAGLGISLAFIAGAVNAGGFLLVGQYTSHMSGILSAMADAVVLHALGPALAGSLAVLAFLSGAGLSAILINWGRRHPRHPPHALPLVLEAVLLLFLGILGGPVRAEPVVALAVPLLCFLMGLQNATITKISGARIRTTHMTGVVTDLGIELGKLAYWNRGSPGPGGHMVRADRAKLRLLGSILSAFILGGVAGAFAFATLGFVSTVPLALALLLLARAIVRAERHLPRTA